MNGYVRNRNCSCVRCRAHSLMGAAILITLGIIFLFDTNHIGRGGHLVPVLLVVIGCMLLLQRTGPTEGHINPDWQAGQIPPPQQYPQQWTSSPTPPPPAVAPPPPPDSNDTEVKP